MPITSSAGLKRSVTVDAGDHPGASPLRVLGRLSTSDAVWSVVPFLAAALARTVTRIAVGASEAIELVFIGLGAGLWIIGYGAGWSLGALAVAAIATAIRLTRAQRAGQAVSWSWWLMPPILLLIPTAPVLMSAYSLLTGASYSGRGIGLLIEFFMDDGRFASGPELVVLWCGKLAFVALGIGVAALAVDRVRHSRARRPGSGSA
ncbi:hypothetical protein [Microbacterium sp. ABRD28]|uniref:hypothetical protein n=1 Tax=Microbacterium sp. ABRD28 TaxID=2268461 RepID=UPI000F557913|nr:hypothetical protein [Microbacterium sp. ABRD28]